MTMVIELPWAMRQSSLVSRFATSFTVNLAILNSGYIIEQVASNKLSLLLKIQK
jgi:hypothetical protein